MISTGSWLDTAIIALAVGIGSMLLIFFFAIVRQAKRVIDEDNSPPSEEDPQDLV